MKWVLCMMLLLGVAWLWMLAGDRKGEDPEVTISKRRKVNQMWQSLPKGEMSIADLERYAAGLSDEELWEEFEKESENWLEGAEIGSWAQRPSDSVVILARAIGRRQGEGGLLAVAGYLIKLKESFSGELGSESKNDFEKLSVSLRYGTFGGWSAARPGEAIGWIIEKIPNPRFRGWVNRITVPLNFANPHGVDGSDFGRAEVFAGERVLRAAFGNLSRQNPDQAIDFMVRGSHSLLFDPN